MSTSTGPGFTLNWRGHEIAARMDAAERVGINQTMARCVVMAKGLVRVDTSTLQGSLKIEDARKTSEGNMGQWGSFDVNYALWQEIGTSKMVGKPYLRPAADFEYGLLGSRIQRAFMAMGG